MNQNSRIIKEEILNPLYHNLMVGDTVDVRGEKTVELLNKTVTFSSDTGIIDIDGIFKTSEKYIEHEMDWYMSQNPNAIDIAEHAKMWMTSSDANMMTNSNYGFLIFSPQNGYQYDNVVKTLKEDPQSRRAVMYYTNPFMHYVGGNDHVCTMYVAYTVRGGKLHAFVNMRSNDVRFGMIGADLEWQIWVLKSVAKHLDVEPGNVHWSAVSLHLYQRHFKQLQEICNG